MKWKIVVSSNSKPWPCVAVLAVADVEPGSSQWWPLDGKCALSWILPYVVKARVGLFFLMLQLGRERWGYWGRQGLLLQANCRRRSMLRITFVILL